MRDLIITLIVFGMIPSILMRPHIGVYVWSWLGYMNPHRLSWGFAYNMPFSAIIAGVLFIGMIFSKEKKKLVWNQVTIAWLVFVFWTIITFAFAMNKDDAFIELDRWLKIQILIICTLMLINSKERLIQLVWVIVLSIGFFGIKGGLFSIATGFHYRITGPADSFITGNNEMALALLMVIPLMYFLFTVSKNKYIKYSLVLSIFLCFVSVITSYSRGALLAAVVMLFFLWLGTKRKLLTMSLIIGVILAGIPFIPDKWFARMDTIQTYEQDASAMGRINAWYFAVNLANDHPLIGGGFRSFTPEAFLKYAPVPNDFHDAHSIYFEVLGEQGYAGLLLFLLLWALVFLEARKVKKMVKGYENLQWMNELVKMVQVGIIAYMSAGAFLGLAYFDLPYHLMSIVVITGVLCREQLKNEVENVQKRDISFAR